MLWISWKGEREGPARNMARKAAKPVIRKVLCTFIDSKLYGFGEASTVNLKLFLKRLVQDFTLIRWFNYKLKWDDKSFWRRQLRASIRLKFDVDKDCNIKEIWAFLLFIYILYQVYRGVKLVVQNINGY